MGGLDERRANPAERIDDDIARLCEALDRLAGERRQHLAWVRCRLCEVAAAPLRSAGTLRDRPDGRRHTRASNTRTSMWAIPRPGAPAAMPSPTSSRASAMTCWK